MIVAKTEQALTHFKNLFQQKSESESIEEKDDAPLKKFYRARCHLTET
jgi:23S rRNA-/tRNA-specific pseudouridylate synthase